MHALLNPIKARRPKHCKLCATVDLWIVELEIKFWTWNWILWKCLSSGSNCSHFSSTRKKHCCTVSHTWFCLFKPFSALWFLPDLLNLKLSSCTVIWSMSRFSPGLGVAFDSSLQPPLRTLCTCTPSLNEFVKEVLIDVSVLLITFGKT